MGAFQELVRAVNSALRDLQRPFVLVTLSDSECVFHLNHVAHRSFVGVKRYPDGRVAIAACAYVAARVLDRAAAEAWAEGRRRCDLGRWALDEDDDMVFELVVPGDSFEPEYLEPLLEVLDAAHQQYPAISKAAEAIHPNHDEEIRRLVALIETPVGGPGTEAA